MPAAHRRGVDEHGHREMQPDCQEDKPKARAALYVDGFNLYHSINDLEEPFLKWCNLWRLGEIIIPQRSEKLVKVVFCTAFYPGDYKKRIRHEALIKALDIAGVETIRGHFSKEPAECYSCGHKWDKPTEKASDIHIALSLYEDACDDVFDTAYLLTSDTDQAATVRFVSRRFAQKKIVSVSPPGRDHSQHILSLTPYKVTLNKDHIERSLFRGFVSGGGKPAVRRPFEYDPPEGYKFWDDRTK